MIERVTIYLEPDMRRSAEAGQHNFIAKIEAVLHGAGAAVSFKDEDERHCHSIGHALVHMKPPMTKETLVFRRVYAYPFWAIEATDKRWNWDVAKADFEPAKGSKEEAVRFVRNWRKRLFGDAKAERAGFVYIALQGRISEHRSFQTMSPLDMIDVVLEHDPKREIIIGLHPKEHYGAADLAALERIEAAYPRVSIVMGQMERYLPRCDYVVTQNSAVAFFGYFFAKPAVLFGQIDFHHIAASAQLLGAEDAIRAAWEMSPEFERYIWWFWQQRSINAGRPDAEDQIRARFERHGWI